MEVTCRPRAVYSAMWGDRCPPEFVNLPIHRNLGRISSKSSLDLQAKKALVRGSFCLIQELQTENGLVAPNNPLPSPIDEIVNFFGRGSWSHRISTSGKHGEAMND